MHFSGIVHPSRLTVKEWSFRHFDILNGLRKGVAGGRPLDLFPGCFSFPAHI